MDEKKTPITNTVRQRPRTLEELEAEVARIRKQASQFDSHAMWSDRELKAQERELRFVRRKVRTLSGVSALLGLMLIGVGIWSTRVMTRVPEASPGPSESRQVAMDAVSRRVDDLTAQLAGLRTDAEIVAGLGERLSAFENSTDSALDALRGQVVQASRVEAEVRLDTARQLDQLHPRIEAAEEVGDQARAGVGQLEQDLSGMKTAVADEISNLRSGTEEALQSTRQRIAGNERAVDAVSWEVGRARLDFELFEDYQTEVAPGIVLNITKTDVPYQRVSGWLHLVRDGRILRLKDQPIQQSLVFYGLDDERSYELVFTRVKRDFAVGYLRIPDDDGIRAVNQVRDPSFVDQASVLR